MTTAPDTTLAPATRRGLTAALGAPIVWSVHFLAVYVLNALACARGVAAGWVVPGILLLTLLAAAGLVALIRPARPHARAGAEAAAPFTSRLGLLLGLLSLLAVLWNALPALFLPAC